MGHQLKLLILVLTLGAVYSTAGWCQASKGDVLEILSQSIDVTGDGVPESIELKLYAESWQNPIRWLLTITQQTKQILTHESDDKWLDEFFSDEGYVFGCKGYLNCKTKYYREDILNTLVKVTDLSPNDHAYNRIKVGGISEVAKRDLIQRHGLDQKRTVAIIHTMVSRLKKGETPVLSVPLSPVQNDFPQMWVPQVEGFVKFYEW